MSCIKIKGYIVSIDEKDRIKIEINDDESVVKINSLINKLKSKKLGKLPIDKECDNRFFIKVNNRTKFKFNNINYNNLPDLYGLEVFITFYYRYYNFITENIGDDGEKKQLFLKGHTFIATKITNIGIFN